MVHAALRLLMLEAAHADLVSPSASLRALVVDKIQPSAADARGDDADDAANGVAVVVVGAGRPRASPDREIRPAQPVEDRLRQPNPLRLEHERMTGFLKELQAKLVSEGDTGKRVEQLLTIILARVLDSSKDRKKLNAEGNRISIDALEVRAYFAVAQARRAGPQFEPERDSEAFQQAARENASPRCEVGPAPQAHEAAPDIGEVISGGRRKRGVHEDESDDAGVGIAVQDRVVCAGAQAADDDPFCLTGAFQPVDRVADIGKSGIERPKPVCATFAVANSREIEAEYDIACLCQRARQVHIHPIVADAMDDSGIEDQNRRAIPA